ncbi:MAG: hypothetical protein ACYDCO_01855 [Armatimonadota bacterium]
MDMYLDGISVPEIAFATEISRLRIWQILSNAGIVVPYLQTHYQDEVKVLRGMLDDLAKEKKGGGEETLRLTRENVRLRDTVKKQEALLQNGLQAEVIRLRSQVLALESQNQMLQHQVTVQLHEIGELRAAVAYTANWHRKVQDYMHNLAHDHERLSEYLSAVQSPTPGGKL